MTGLWTDIVKITAPESASPGQTVNVSVDIKNLLSYAFYIAASALVNGSFIYFTPDKALTQPGASSRFNASFVMPNKDVTLTVTSYMAVEGPWGDEWYLDDQQSVVIALAGVATFHLDVNVPPWATGGYILPGSGDYPAYSTVVLTAHPLSGYQFTGWGGAASGSATTYSLYMDSDKYVEAYFEEVAVPLAGTITKMELEYDGARAPIPAYDIPQNKSGLVHVLGLNDSSVRQDMGIHWLIYDRDGILVEDYWDWSYGIGPGDDHWFRGGRFNLDKPGPYAINLALSMNPAAPQIVDSYSGVLCTVAAAVPEPEFRGFGVIKYVTA